MAETVWSQVRSFRFPSWWRTKTVQEWIKNVIVYTLLIILGVIFIFPFFWMVTSALKPQYQIFVWPPQWIPDPIMWENFAEALGKYDLARPAAPDSPELAFDRGLAQLKLERLDDAAAAFNQAVLSGDRNVETASKFLLGNVEHLRAVQAREQDPRAAIEALQRATQYYLDALAVSPEDDDLRANIELAQNLIDLIQQEQQQQQQQQQQQGDQENQEQQESQDQQQEQDGQQDQQQSPDEQQPEQQDEQESDEQQENNKQEPQQEPQSADGQGEQQDQQDQQQAQDAEQNEDDSEREQARQVSAEQAERMFQQIRDKERKRRLEKAKRARRDSTAVKKDW